MQLSVLMFLLLLLLIQLQFQTLVCVLSGENSLNNHQKGKKFSPIDEKGNVESVKVHPSLDRRPAKKVPKVVTEVGTMKMTEEEEPAVAPIMRMPADQGKEKSKILLMADNNSYSHFNLMLKIVNILNADGHEMHFLVDDHKPGMELANKLADGVTIIRVPPDPKLANEFFKNRDKSAFSSWTESSPSSHQEYHWMKMGYRAIALYKEVVEDQPELLNWLRQQNFQLAVAENRDLGAFALFHELGIPTTIATIATHPLPAFLHFLGLPMLDVVPEHYTGGMGLGLVGPKGLLESDKTRRENAREYRQIIQQFEKVYAQVHAKHYVQRGHSHIPSPVELFRRVRYFLSNNCEPWTLPRPTLAKIRNIGGIGVDMHLLAMKFQQQQGREEEIRALVSRQDRVQPWMLKAECLVLFALGSLIKFDDFSSAAVDKMLDAFAQVREHEACVFIVKIPEAKFAGKVLPDYVKPMEWIPLQPLLALKTVRLVITHCGQNSFIESLYAAVPSLCLPFFGDQLYNSAIAEYLHIGIWVRPTQFTEQFPGAMQKLMAAPPNNSSENLYRQSALKIAKLMHMDPEKPRAVLTQLVKKAIQQSAILFGGGNKAAAENQGEEGAKENFVEKDGKNEIASILMQQNIPGLGIVPMIAVQMESRRRQNGRNLA